MDITLSRRGDYAIRAILDVARAPGRGRRKSREIAEAMKIPPKYLSQILARLVRRQLLIGTAGQDGGYELARPASEIRLLDVIEAVEGPATLPHCVLRGIPCETDGTCAVHEAWSSAQQALKDRLASTTFREIAEQDRALRGRSGPARPARKRRTNT